MKSPIIFIILLVSFIIPKLSAQSNDTTLAHQYFDKGIELHRQQSKYDSAAMYFEKAANIYAKQSIWVKSVKSYGQCGWAYYYDQNIESSFQFINKGLELSEKHFKNPTAEELVEMITLHRYKGVLSKYSNDYETALEYYNKSLNYNEDLKPHDSLNYLINKSKIHYAVGVVYTIKRNKKLALDHLKKSLEIQKELPFDPDFNIALTYINIGNVYRKYEDFETAAQYYLEANKVITPEYNNYLNLKSYCLNQISAIYLNKGELSKSLIFMRKYIDINIALYDTNHRQVAIGYFNYALICAQIGKLTIAESYFNKSMDIYSIDYDDNAVEISKIYFQLGLLEESKKSYQKSIDYFNIALKIQTRYLGMKHYLVSQTYYQIGKLNKQIHNETTALNFYQKSIISIVRDFNNLNVLQNPSINDNPITKIDLLRPLKSKATLLYQLYLDNPNETNMLIAALDTYLLLFQLTKSFRKDFKSEEAKLILGETSKSAYNEAINICNKISNLGIGIHDSTIFSFMEEAKSATLFSLMHEYKALCLSGVPQSIILQENELKKDLYFFKTQIEKLTNQEKEYDTTLLNKYEKRYFELFEESDSLHSYISNNYPLFNSIISNEKRTSIKEIQKALDPSSALIEYFTGESSLYIAVITNEEFHLEITTIDSTLEEITIKYIRNIKKGESCREFANMSFELYKRLIDPIKAHVVNIEKLIIIPDEFLYYLPFETLCINGITENNDINFSNLDYLIRKYEIAYNYSASLWHKSMLNSDIKQTPRFGDDVFCAFAPVFTKTHTSELSSNSISSKSRTEARNLNNKYFNFNELPYTITEVETLADLFNKKGYKTSVYLNQDATEYRFKNEINNYQYIHVATHGFSNDNPNLSGIVFTQHKNETVVDETSTNIYKNSYGKDGILYAGEMYHLKLNANLIVLSTCESGIGKLRTGEGLMSITRGLIYSGVPNIVISLWKVSDKHTSIMMLDFYKEILEGNSYSNSLRKSKINMIENEATSYPKLWSGFVLTGQ